MVICERASALGVPPFIEGPPPDAHSLAATNYRVWLPDDASLGVVETSPRHSYESPRRSYYHELHANLEALTTGPMGEVLTEVGYSTHRDGDVTCTTFPSLSTVVAYGEKRAALYKKEPPFIRFKEYDGQTYSDIEFLTNLRDGFVLISNSTAPHTEYTDENLYVTENHPRLIHDMLLHVPAWLCLPPTLTHELQQAAANILAERDRIIARQEPLHAINWRITEMMGFIDSAVNTYDIRGVVEGRVRFIPNFGLNIGKATGKTSKTDARRYEQLVRDYAVEPFRVDGARALFIGGIVRTQLEPAA